MKEHALTYLAAGLSVLPAHAQLKYAAVKQWKPYQLRLPTEAEVRAWFSNNHDGLCIIAGAVSGNLEMMDFDLEAELFEPWCARVKEAAPELLERLVIETSQSGGRHVMYRCQSEVSGSVKLAQRKVIVPSGDEVIVGTKPFKPRQDKYGQWSILLTLIETRGEGGLFLCAPTPGYTLLHGTLTDIPVLTADQRELLLEAAWTLSEYFPEPEATPTPPAVCGTLRPGDDYNARGDVRALLHAHGWTCAKGGDNEYWRRPGKTLGWSASLKDGVFYVWSTNASPFEAKKPYPPFITYTLLEHHGDFSAAASELAKQGYGDTTPNTDGVDLSAIVSGGDTDDDDDETFLSKFQWNGVRLCTLKDMLADFQGLNKPIIHGLLREGETMNIIAAPKVGKSWLVNSLAISIASGLDWLGFSVDCGRVLLIDNELHSNTSTYRYNEVTRAMQVEPRLYHTNLRHISLRGLLMDLNQLQELFCQFRPNLFRVIIIDAFYRTLPEGTDENDNGAIAKLYNSLDKHANRLNCAFILIHHTSKGNQANKSVTDVGAGAGSQSRAVDTHLVLRPHDEEDTIVMEAAMRSWPPLQSVVLRKQHPLFVVDPNADPTALLGAEKKREPKKQLTLEEFVQSCIAGQDPCSLSEIIYQATQLNLSERKAKEMLAIATDKKQVVKFKAGSQMRYAKYRQGYTDQKGQWIAALLAHNPDMDTAEIARITDTTDRYVRQLKSGTEGGTG